MSQILGDFERLRIVVQEESQRRMEVENIAVAAAADVMGLVFEAENFHASLDEEKRRHEQVQRDLAVEKESTRRAEVAIAKLKMSIKATRRPARQKSTDGGPVRAMNDRISRYAVATFRLHTAQSKTTLYEPSNPSYASSEASSFNDAIDRLNAFSITDSEEKPVMSQQLVFSLPTVNPQQAIVPQQAVIDQPPTPTQQLVLYQSPIGARSSLVTSSQPYVVQQVMPHKQPIDHQSDVAQDPVVRQATVIGPEPAVDQISAVKQEPRGDQWVVVDQPLIREPVDKDEPAGGLDMGTAGDPDVNLGKTAPSGSHESSRDPRPNVTHQVDEEAEGEDTSPFQPQPAALSESVIGPVSGIQHHTDPSMPIFSGFLLKPKGKIHKYSTEQIEKMKSKVSEAGLAGPKTHFSSKYLARLRAQMADISVMRKLMGDDTDEDEDWVVQVRHADQELGETALCNMSEETQYAVPPYTKHMIEQMMESFFLACV